MTRAEIAAIKEGDPAIVRHGTVIWGLKIQGEPERR